MTAQPQPVHDGHLLHLISDSQWVMHWLLYLGDGDTSAVVATPRPIGFDLDEDEEGAYWAEHPWEYVRCAETFRECIWRCWMDNEIFYRVVIDRQLLSSSKLTQRPTGRPARLTAPEHIRS